MKIYPELPDTLEWKIGTSVLCNYMRKLEYLEMILKNQAIVPRYNIESVEYLHIDGLDRICFPMTCFCDIPFSMASTHMSKYGTFGIGFDKKVMMQRNRVQPIHYISEYSNLIEDFRKAFLKYNQTSQDGTSPVELLNYLTTTFLYMKPIWGKEEDEDGNYTDYVYQNESEWRYVPASMPSGFPMILPHRYSSKTGCDKFSEGLLKHPEIWLRFEWNDVCYIMVPNSSAERDVIKIIRKLAINEEIQDVLVAKIEISRRFSLDR